MSASHSFRDQVVQFMSTLQSEICAGLEAFEPSNRFESKTWQRPGGGGGQSRILQNGEVFEKGGVNVSAVHGTLPPLMVEKLKATTAEFFATGVSLVIHPRSPAIPTIHANFRYFEQPDRSWFGGGIDLTPYIYDEDSFRHFHRTLKTACDTWSADAYADWKLECDKYFCIHHRGETRGIGGIFFDYVSERPADFFRAVQTMGRAFLPAYQPLVERGLSKSFSEREKKYQLLRRGRYVEFNLVHDRGTLFGLQTNGNIESILMSLPPVVNFDSFADLEQTESEKKLLEVFRTPKTWV